MVKFTLNNEVLHKVKALKRYDSIFDLTRKLVDKYAVDKQYGHIHALFSVLEVESYVLYVDDDEAKNLKQIYIKGFPFQIRMFNKETL